MIITTFKTITVSASYEVSLALVIAGVVKDPNNADHGAGRLWQ
jgi:hypothetical protein